VRTTVRLNGEVWYLIEDFEHFSKRWAKAKRKKTFFPVRYAGRRMWVNPEGIIYATNYWR
jgi:hypothetical protein